MKINKRQIAPLIFLSILMFAVIQRAFESGRAREIGIVFATAEGCTTLGALLAIPSLAIWLWLVRTKRSTKQNDSQAIMAGALRLETRGHVGEAIAKYEEVIQRFPSTEAAKDVEVSIRSLKGQIG